jgi:hypothetical protein
VTRRKPAPGVAAETVSKLQEQKRKAAEALKLIQSRAPGAVERDSYQRHREAMTARKREMSAAARDVGEIPAPVHPDRVAACRLDFRLFCETYHPATFSLGWSPDHLKVIAKIEAAVLRGGLFAVAMPRGGGKTSLCQVAAEWALLYGHRRFVVLVSADSDGAASALKSIRLELETNDEIDADFPAVTIPLRKLDGIHQRRLMFEGRTLRQSISRTDLVLADIPGPACEGRVRCVGITASMRGMVQALGDGSRIRPDMVIVDDPQTDESARSPAMTAAREGIIHGTILGLAGPRTSIAAIAPVTVIQQGDLADRILSPDLHPDWQGERCKLVYAWPESDEAKRLWDKYREIRLDSLRAGRGIADATEFVRQNYDAMHAGAVLGWAERFKHDECSALQSAWNIRLRNEAAFMAEYQNDPAPLSIGIDVTLSAAEIAAKINRRDRGVCPINTQHVTAMIDVQERLLYYAVIAWEPNFTGYVVDYGTYPEQPGPYHTYAEARRTLADLGVPGEEAAIHAGLEQLTSRLAAIQWPREDGATLSVDRIQIDANYKSDTIYAFCSAASHRQIITPSHGKYVGARSAPFSDYKKRPGDRVGHNWRQPNVSGRRATRYTLFDSNYWKSFIYARLQTPMGGPGCLSLWGSDPIAHRLLADHLVAEYRTRTRNQDRGRDCDEWSAKPGKPDNHLFDCLVGAAVAASMQGVELAGTGVAQQGEQRKKAEIPAHLRRR